MSELYEKLAEIEHQRWSSWMNFQFSLCILDADGSTVIPAAYVHRWRRQIITDYKDLSESEKNSDREQVDRYWPLIQARIKALEGVVEFLRFELEVISKFHVYKDDKIEATAVDMAKKALSDKEDGGE